MSDQCVADGSFVIWVPALGLLQLAGFFCFQIYVILEKSSAVVSFVGLGEAGVCIDFFQGWFWIGYPPRDFVLGKFLPVVPISRSIFGRSGRVIIVLGSSSRGWSSGWLGSSFLNVGDQFSSKIWINSVLTVFQAHELIWYWIKSLLNSAASPQKEPISLLLFCSSFQLVILEILPISSTRMVAVT